MTTLASTPGTDMAALFPTVVGPGFAPTTLDRTTDDFIRRIAEGESAKRKVHAKHKRQIWDESFGHLVQKLIQERWEDADIRQRMAPWITLDVNAGKDITRHIAIAYSYGTRRLLQEATGTEEKSWRKLLRKIDTQMIGVNRGAFLAGPMAVIPVVKNGRLEREIRWPDTYDVRTAPGDPLGPIIAAGWEVNDGTDVDQTDRKRVAYVVVDQEAWHYFNRNRQRVSGPDGLEVVPHGCTDERGDPSCPVEIFRLDDPQDPDWWSATTNDRLLWASVEICLTLTRLRFIRKSNDSKTRTFFAPTSTDRPKGQILVDPEGAIEAFSKTAPAIQFNVHDTIVDPVHHFSEIMFAYGNLVESYGLPASSLSWNFMGSGETVQPSVTINASRKHLSHIRSEHIRFFDDSERNLSVKTAAIVRASGDADLMKDIPPPDEMHARHILEYPDLDTIDDPKVRREQDDWDRQNGLTSRVDLVQRKHVHMSREEALDLIKRNVEEETEVNDLLAKRNLPLGQDVSVTADEANGAMGPEVRDAPRGAGPPQQKPPGSGRGADDD